MINMDAKSVVISSKCLQGFHACDTEYLQHAVLDYSGFCKSVVLLNLTGWVTVWHGALPKIRLNDAPRLSFRGSATTEESHWTCRTVDLWIATLTTLQTVQSFAMTDCVCRDSSLALKNHLQTTLNDGLWLQNRWFMDCHGSYYVWASLWHTWNCPNNNKSIH